MTFFAFLTACNSKSDNIKSDPTKQVSKKVESNKFEKSTQKALQIDNIMECDFVYDTITNNKYNMHLGILEKFHDKEKRGYFFSSEGDTLNNFLYHQDIAAFILGLDSTEKGMYKRLTNKVVFLILEQDPKMLDYGLTQWTKDEKKLDYFMEHVSNPICNTMPIDSIISIIEQYMGEPHDGAKKIKKILLQRLEMNKK